MSHPSGVRKESLSSSPVAPFLLSIPPTPLPPHHPSAPGALATPNIRRILAILAVVSALAVLAFPHSSSSFTYGTPPSMDEFIFPRAIYGKNSTLTTYLDERWPVTFGVAAEGESGEGSESPSDASSHPPSYLEPHIWLTMADEAWVGGGTAALGVFVDKLNDDRRRRVGPEARETVLVVLCLDEGCIERCERRGLFCYGGFQYTRPAKILVSTWPKLAGLIEVLATRDVFFVDSDVAFKYDPYPIMEPLMQAYDIIAQENDAYYHLNTGWMWLRKDPRLVQAWEGVLAMDMVKTSRDQVNFNTVLETATRRLKEDVTERPLLQNFLSPTGLRVHILDDRLARSYHFELDRPSAARHESSYLHTTCAEDYPMKEYVAKTQGYWQNVDSYYTSPLKVLSVNHLSGTQQQVTKAIQILLAVAYYTGRAFEPPATVVFTDLHTHPRGPRDRQPPSNMRLAYSAFPFARIASPEVVEPGYTEHAIQHLAGFTTAPQFNRTLPAASLSPPSAIDLTRIRDLLEVDIFDIRPTKSLGDLIFKLRQPSLLAAQSIQLVNLDWTDASWMHWMLPQAIWGVQPCAELQHLPGCGSICRGPREMRATPKWPDLDVVVSGG